MKVMVSVALVVKETKYKNLPVKPRLPAHSKAIVAATAAGAAAAAAAAAGTLAPQQHLLQGWTGVLATWPRSVGKSR